MLAAQLTKHPGGLINLVRSHAGTQKLRNRLPGVPVIATSDPGWQKEVRAIACERPITAAIDAVAGELAADLLDLLAPGGTLLTYGALAAEPVRIHASSLFPKGPRIEAMTISRWQASVSQQRRAWDIDTARALARNAVARCLETVRSAPVGQRARALGRRDIRVMRAWLRPWLGGRARGRRSPH